MGMKGNLIKKLKQAGVRRGNKDGAIVCLEQLKTADVIKLYYEKCVDNKN